MINKENQLHDLFRAELKHMINKENQLHDLFRAELKLYGSESHNDFITYNFNQIKRYIATLPYIDVTVQLKDEGKAIKFSLLFPDDIEIMLTYILGNSKIVVYSIFKGDEVLSQGHDDYKTLISKLNKYLNYDSN